MGESKTFDRLRRTPLHEMSELIDIKNFQSVLSPSFTWGDYTFDSSSYIKRELEYHRWRIALLEEHGWSFEDFMIESERDALLRMIHDYNSKNAVPTQILDRIRMVFPDATFTPARLETNNG